MSRLPVVCLLIAAASVWGCGRGPVIDPVQITAPRIAETLPTEDPAAALWNEAPEHPVSLLVQDVVEPKLAEPGAAGLRVRALHNGSWIVFRLEWEDGTRDALPETGVTSDSVALQLPLLADPDVPDPAMGEAGKGVQIAYWKAVWQDDVERTAREEDRIDVLYPNASIDHYPYLANPAAQAEMARRYAPAEAAGNPVTARPNASAVQELMAEGYGTTTVADVQRATGRGVWVDGRWLVTIARPLDEGEEMARLTPGSRTWAAFAVWDGAARQAGARKMRSQWVPLVLENVAESR